MSKPTKNYSVLSTLEAVNNYLAFESKYITKEMRIGAYVILEDILHKSGNYSGFGYINGYTEGMDDSRRFYYKSHNLTKLT
jgi:hypothetical protein